LPADLSLEPAAETAEPNGHAAPPGPLRVAVIGCGYISQQLHLPILAGHERARLVALVDRDVERARRLARGYGVETVLDDAGGLGRDRVDAAVVATPPSHHAPCAIELMRRGIHVLVEKPLALTSADAEAMVRAADEAGVVLAVGFFRRLMPSVRLLRSLVDSRRLGRPVGFDIVSGSFGGAGSLTLGNLRRETAGGGLLMDFGSHLLDLLHYVFPGTGEVLEYRDNALGGVESDCLLRLRLTHGGEAVDGRVELSRTRELGSRFRILCERGSLEYRLTERYRIRIVEGPGELEDPLDHSRRPYTLEAAWSDEPEAPWYETMRAEIDDFVGAVRAGRPPELSGRSALPTTRVIEECYRRAQPLPEAWVREGLRRPNPAAGHAPAAGNGKRRRVLLTGATGFIGCRVAEVLALRDGWEVRALVHNPANATRLARLPVEMVQADLGAGADAARLVGGCDAIVHCAVGTAYGDRRKVYEVTVGGTRSLARAALAAGAARFVHISTIAVHGFDHGGVLDESAPVRPPAGDDYGGSKAEAERALLEAVRDGLSATVLRPARVYGPFGQTFISRPVGAMARGGFRLLGAADGPAGMVYVDNVVEMIVRALEAPDAAVRGEAFLAADDGSAVSWREFYAYFARGLGLGPPPGAGPADPGPANAPPRGGWFGAAMAVLTSPEFRALGKRVLETDPLGRLPRWLLARPGVERRLRRWLKADDSLPAYRRPQPEPAATVSLGGTSFHVSTAKAQRVLGYTPVVPHDRAMALTLDWVRHARLAAR
jgi:predicted dehydrogenase/nucleoside-diphosphate-sugar epimerase